MTPRERIGPTYDSVIAALEDGHGYVANIAEYTGKSKDYVRRVLRQYESKGIAGRWHGSDHGSRADYWVIVPLEHRADARRRHADPTR